MSFTFEQPPAVIIVAGGKGLRMGGELPKQFLPLNGIPVLARTILQFCRFLPEAKLVIVIPQPQIELFSEICSPFLALPNTVYICNGGETRTESVWNGLDVLNCFLPADIEAQTLVAIHDGVRPLVSREAVLRSFEAAAQTGAAVCAVPVKATLREKTENGSRTLDRSRFYEVQTPQTFRFPLVYQSYKNRPANQTFTDDASVVEAAGHTVTMVDGDYWNIKITTPEDLALAEIRLKSE